MRVRDLMSGPADRLVHGATSDTVQKLAVTLSQANVGALPILEEDGRLLGVVSERDIVRVLALDGHAALTLTAGELMTRAVVFCNEDAGLATAGRLMERHGIRHLPVADRAGKLVGFLSQRDLMRGSLKSLQAGVGSNDEQQKEEGVAS